MLASIRVAPLAGAWIETKLAEDCVRDGEVAPLAGAWIETGINIPASTWVWSRTPRGCVD